MYDLQNSHMLKKKKKKVETTQSRHVSVQKHSVVLALVASGCTVATQLEIQSAFHVLDQLFI